jgi:septal ring-binding cell division protein DamX
MDETEPSGASGERVPLPPLPDRDSVEEFTVTEKQRQAALNHLDAEFNLGHLDVVELERRKSAVTTATNVAELLAATAPVQTAEPTPAAPVRRTSPLAVIAMVVVGLLLVMSVVSKLA